jgi:uncharacterized membrane protein
MNNGEMSLNKKIKKNSILPLTIYDDKKKQKQLINVDTYNYNNGLIMKEGNRIYNENHYISKIWDIMSDKNFSEFFDSYLKDYSDVQVAMVFFNVYKCIKEQYNNIFNKEIKKEEMVYMLREIMRNDFMRKYMIQNTSNMNLVQLQSDIISKDIFTMIQKNNLLQ